MPRLRNVLSARLLAAEVGANRFNQVFYSGVVRLNDGLESRCFNRFLSHRPDDGNRQGSQTRNEIFTEFLTEVPQGGRTCKYDGIDFVMAEMRAQICQSGCLY